MYKYEKENLTYVTVEGEDLQAAKLLQGQLGGVVNKASVQFMVQGYSCDNEELGQVLLNLAAEEMNHYELLSLTIKNLAGDKGAKLCSGTLALNDIIVVTGDICTDLLSDIALLEQEKSIYESVYRQISDVKVKSLLTFIIKRIDEHSSLLREEFNKLQREKVKKDYKKNGEAKVCFSTIKPKLKEDAYDDFKKTPPTGLR